MVDDNLDANCRLTEGELDAFGRVHDLLNVMQESTIGGPDNLAGCNRWRSLEADAVKFASDNGYTTCFTLSDGSRRCPWGVHKPWVKADVSQLTEGCPSIADSRAAWVKDSTCAADAKAGLDATE